MSATTTTVAEIVAYAFGHGAERVSSRRGIYAYQQTEWVNGPKGVKADSTLVTRDDAAYDTVTARWSHGSVVVATIADGCAVVAIGSGTDSTGTSWDPSEWREVIEEQGAKT